MNPTIESPTAALDAALAALIRDTVPARVSTSWISKTFGITKRSVVSAISTGKLPADELRSLGGNVAAYSIRPSDAFLIWGHRLLKPKTEEA